MLTPGTRLGVYEITDSLGAGGMGEVYRARDTKLRRDVAIKILPEIFAADPDRVTRFQREAELLATLNHPNIAQIYGLERQTGQEGRDGQEIHAIVLELVEGETLEEKLKGLGAGRSGLPLDEALPIARQIVDALEAAHERGVVHRDLKPANIKITPDGKVKVLDFGLAKAIEGSASLSGERPGMSMSPTLSVHATYAGIILGTAAYMSPEQARGKPVDRRTDIWAFGCVLYEMLAGKQAFEGGETVSDAIAAILKGDVDWTALPADVPPYVRRLLQRCLQKDPRKRLPHIGLVRLELDDPPVDIPPQPAPIGIAPTRSRWLYAIAAALAVAAFVGIAAFAGWTLKPSPQGVVTRFTIQLPDGQQFSNSGRRIVAVAPDGTKFVYVANQHLFLRTMGQEQVRSIQGSDSVAGVVNPTFSPDGQSVAFYATVDRTLKRIPVNGGTPITLGPSTNPYGLSWQGDYIYSGQGTAGIERVPATGGKPETIVTVDAGELAHGPQLLPDGQTLLFTLARATGGTDRWDKARIVAQSLKTGVRTTVIEGGSDGRYLPTGHLVYALAGVIMAVPFDAAHLRVLSGPMPVLEGVRRTTPTATAQISMSATGLVVYAPGPTVSSAQQDLALFDRQGQTQPLKLPPASYDFPRLSPDGRRVAYSVDDGRDASIWIYELSGAASPRRLTIGGRSRIPVWSGDGQRVIFQSDRDGIPSLYWQPADGSGAAERLTTAEPRTLHVPESASRDGRYLLFARSSENSITSWVYSFADRKATQFPDVQSASVPSAAFSPDGRWVAYSSTDNAVSALRIYVQPFPPTGAKYEIGGGIHPLWSSDGTELFFTAVIAGNLAAVRISTRPSFSIGKPALFVRGTRDGGPQFERPFDIGPDGRFIGVLDVVESGAAADAALVRAQELRVVTNWFEELKQRVPIK